MANEVPTERFIGSMLAGLQRIGNHPNADEFFEDIKEIDQLIWNLVDAIEES